MPALTVSAALRRDAFVGIAMTVVAEVELLMSADRVEGALVAHQLVTLLIAPALALRRLAPFSSILVAAVGLAVEPPMGASPVATPYLVLLAVLVSLGWYAALRTGLIGLAIVLVSGFAYDVVTNDFLLADLVVNVVIIVMAWGAGHLVRRATDRRVRAEVAADRAARDAVVVERERISRDLHDSVAHALTLITLQAGGARERTDPGLASDALRAIERSGREALADMHRFLDLLGSGSDDARGIGHLPELVEGVRRGGLDVELEVHPDDLPTSLSTTVYRVVQEGLTNVVRHSSARSARVVVTYDEDVVVATVSDDGQPQEARVRGSGRGLAGLRERLTLYDGTLDFASTPSGWRLVARIPLVRAAR